VRVGFATLWGCRHIMAVICSGWIRCLAREVLKCLVPGDGVSWGSSSLMAVISRMLGGRSPAVAVCR